MAVLRDDTSSSPKKPKRTPCTNCRQQKAKCDAEPGSGKPCTRCAKLGASCVVATEFKREMKRRRVDDAVSPVGHRTSSSLPTPLATTDDDKPTDGPTLPRSLDAVSLDSATIDSLFDTFFRRYHPFLPILEPHMLPNAYYARCPLTFFSIVAVAAQKSSPSLTTAMASSVYNLALTSTKSKSNYYNSIHATLLLLTWPLERVPDNDATFPLSASMMHMALSIGLHIPLSTAEFARLGQKLTEADLVHRITLWAQCQITYARCSTWKGVMAFTIHQSKNDNVSAAKIPPELRFHRRVHYVTMKFFEAAQEVGVKGMNPEQDHSIAVLIKVFDDQLRNIEDEQYGEIDKLYVAMARLQILIYHFFRSTHNVPAQAIAAIYNTSCAIITATQRLDSTTQLASVAPFYVAAGVLIAAHSMLRICKTVSEPWLDQEEAVKTLFDGIDLAKRLSKDHNDICNRCAYRMLQVWQSKRSYRKPDGSPDFEMRAKNRHALSVVLDAMWRWREEFEDSDPNGVVAQAQNPADGSMPMPALDSNGLGGADVSTMINDQFLFDFGLDMDFGEDWMTMPTAEPTFGR